ncbi:MAG TPA: 3-phosphoshikimate 1-carboxyvinyltransferase [Verrucomicrobiae bacterium]|nr:3-phosphoshikimate 1-carboxyvinyltransferase [Verrucomicrobiae bacterium]
MPLPDLIEIVPLEKPVLAEITVPGSKSITNRALILAALAQGETTLRGALWSEDTQVMVEGLRALGFVAEVADDPQEFCNRTITVRGLGGKIPRGGTLESPLEIFVRNAGTAARFLTALVCLGNGIHRVHGVKRMHQRPQEALFDALRELGYCIDSVNDKLPATVHGTGPREGTCCVSIAESSQFASALLLCAKAGGWRVNVVGENAEESPYVAMTTQLIEKFPKCGGEFQIEPDASSGSYFVGAGWLLSLGDATQSSVRVASWPTSGWQIDAVFSKTRVAFVQRISRRNDLGDSIMTAIALAPFEEGAGPQVFVDLERLRLQECDRVEAIRTELTRCGAKVVEEDDTLEVFPSRLHGAEIETYHDHRMAMCFAILGLKVSGIKIKNPACVKKSFPNFFQKLAAPPPHGLGATILDARTARALAHDELFAE